eukprot:TRINITY_DN3014_c0_g1_i2.p1 TRINITY_DN3014_c0_g1~~TRINITY_DN3014_c0_g1_i2.p1  ORF type:complete len:360 (-),score=104.21 TRINITY_DN3014_c0_g1_i2:46-1095(-)
MSFKSNKGRIDLIAAHSAPADPKPFDPLHVYSSYGYDNIISHISFLADTELTIRTQALNDIDNIISKEEYLLLALQNDLINRYIEFIATTPELRIKALEITSKFTRLGYVGDFLKPLIPSILSYVNSNIKEERIESSKFFKELSLFHVNILNNEDVSTLIDVLNDVNCESEILLNILICLKNVFKDDDFILFHARHASMRLVGLLQQNSIEVDKKVLDCLTTLMINADIRQIVHESGVVEQIITFYDKNNVDLRLFEYLTAVVMVLSTYQPAKEEMMENLKTPVFFGGLLEHFDSIILINSLKCICSLLEKNREAFKPFEKKIVQLKRHHNAKVSESAAQCHKMLLWIP